MRQNQTQPAPETKPSVGEKLDIETQNPLRKEPRYYHDAKPTYDEGEITYGKKVFHTQNEFTHDLDDEEEISAQLTEAGVHGPQTEEDMSRDDAVAEDREFEMGRRNNESEEGPLDDDETDFDVSPDLSNVRVDGEIDYA